ncbi:MAG: class B sortase [Candidatus Fimenecus sp.]
MAKHDEQQNEVLSFDELKKKLASDGTQENNTQEVDTVEALLSSLRDAKETPSDTASAAKPPAETPPPTEAKADDDAQESRSIYDDVLRSVMETTPETKAPTGRKSKFLSEGDQFVDVTDNYHEYADLSGYTETAPLADTEKSNTAVSQPPKSTKEYRTFNEIFKSAFLKIFPNKHDTVGEGIRKVITDLAVVTLACCLVYFGVYGVQSYQASKQNKEIKGQIIDDTGTSTDSDVWSEFLSKYPNINLPEGMMAKYAYLYAINQDLVGWIQIPNSLIDVQVVQAEDNATYLKKDFYGNYSRYGCPCMDYRNDPKYLNKNTIIYGHHMSDGLVFADLKKYKTVEGFQESPVIEFDTLYRSYKFKIYAVLITNSKEEDDNGYIFNYTVTDFGTNDKFMEYIAAVDERKLYSTGVDIQPTDKILTLQTCTYEFSDARLVVIGRMLRENESTVIDTSLAKVNENPRYPQAYYDKLGQENPYANAEKWTINGSASVEPTDPA